MNRQIQSLTEQKAEKTIFVIAAYPPALRSTCYDHTGNHVLRNAKESPSPNLALMPQRKFGSFVLLCHYRHGVPLPSALPASPRLAHPLPVSLWGRLSRSQALEPGRSGAGLSHSPAVLPQVSPKPLHHLTSTMTVT